MRKIATFLIILGIASLSFYISYRYINEKQNIEGIEEYLEETKITDFEQPTIEKESVEVEEPKKEEKQVELDYKAILEIPSINLKRGLVESTKGFKSINYAISIDNSSNYPNTSGNFILYAHSGNAYYSYFRNLGYVNINDNIYVYYQGIKYFYKVYKIYEIDKTGTMDIIRPADEKIITLLTCKNGTEKQIVVLGKQIDSERY